MSERTKEREAMRHEFASVSDESVVFELVEKPDFLELHAEGTWSERGEYCESDPLVLDAEKAKALGELLVAWSLNATKGEKR